MRRPDLAIEPPQQQHGTLGHVLDPPGRHRNACPVCKRERRALPNGDADQVVMLREFGDRQVAVAVDDGGLWPRAAKRGAGRQQ